METNTQHEESRSLKRWESPMVVVEISPAVEASGSRIFVGSLVAYVGDGSPMLTEPLNLPRMLK